MKKKLTILLPFCLMILMIMATTQVASAAEVSGEVSFDGDRVNISYSKDEFKSKLTSLLPGEDASLTLSLVNNSKKKTDWYVENKVVKTFEEGIEASGGAYTYEILYFNSKGKKNVIFSSDRVGGEGSKGLSEVTGSTENYFYLSSLKPDEMGIFKINMKIDGETVSNDYQRSMADVDVNFGVEVARADVPGDEDTDDPGDKGTPEKTKTPHDLVKTGDDSSMTIYVLLCILAAIALAAVVISWVKGKKGGSNEKNS